MKRIVCNVSLMLAVIFMGSCSSDNDLSAEALMSSPKTERGSSNVVLENNYKEAENKDNPFDYYGIIHNNVLKEAIDNNTTDIEESYYLTIEIFNEKYGWKEFENEKFLTFEETKVIADDHKDFCINIANKYLKDDVEYNKTVIQFLTMIKEYSEGPYITYSELKNKIVNFEKGVVDSETLSKEDKEKMLKTTAIARYSFYFWYTQGKSPNLTAKRKWWEWVLVGVADIVGGAVEGLKGACTASKTAGEIIDWAKK